jgi:hypothetical protein
MNKLKNVHYGYLLIFGIIVFILFVFVTYFTLSSVNLFNSLSPEPTASIDSSGVEPGALDPEKGAERAALADQPPHTGDNFGIAINDEAGRFDVYINPNNQTAGMNEFEKFLQENNLTLQDMAGFYEITNSPL